ncbi:LAFE_0E09516g1_1 [Lachancea fermentati]|uniref:LAFE_0E09516g1_1 n=1 Tax=Lachancea fermentati TaxID=4955 RepID=A0A1G4MDE5_LACFM|nr:LAFE_0E09516g1_1 [Lachancea fermentati]
MGSNSNEDSGSRNGQDNENRTDSDKLGNQDNWIKSESLPNHLDSDSPGGPKFNQNALVSDAMAKNSRQLLYAHIYNYLIQHKYYDTARRLLNEADVPLSKTLSDEGPKEDELLHAKMLMNSKDTFLFEWWQSLWTLHDFVESQPTETISSDRFFREPITPILPQPPSSTQVMPSTGIGLQQQQPYMQVPMPPSQLTSHLPTQMTMGPPKVNDTKDKKSAAADSPPKKSNVTYPRVPKASTIAMQSQMAANGTAGSPHQTGAGVGSAMHNGQSILTTPLYTNSSSMGLQGPLPSSQQPPPSQPMNQRPMQDYQQGVAYPQAMMGSQMAHENMMMYYLQQQQQQQREMMMAQGEDDTRTTSQGNWGPTQQQLQEQYQKTMLMMQQSQQQQQQQKRPPMSRTYSHPTQAMSANQMAQKQHAMQQSRMDAQFQQQGQQGQSTLSHQQSAQQQSLSAYSRHRSPVQQGQSTQYVLPQGDGVPDNGLSSNSALNNVVDPSMQQQYLNNMMMQQSQNPLSPVGTLGTMNGVPTNFSGTQVGNSDKFADGISNDLLGFGIPLPPHPSQPN